MSIKGEEIKSENVDVALEDMTLDRGARNGSFRGLPTMDGQSAGGMSPVGLPKPQSPSPLHDARNIKDEGKSESVSPDSQGMAKGEDILEGEVTVKIENGKLPKLSRRPSQKNVSRSAPLFDHLADSTSEATSVFQVIRDCIYGSKHMGSSEHDALGCDCSEEWHSGRNHACGEDSDCINRATKMECLDDECNCGAGCQNQRFQRKEYANVSVIKTEKKGYGLRTDADLLPNDFIFEYIGEVINEPTFRRRTIQYDEEGIKHFYFMSLNKNEFVDATKKGNLGRFCNHSCNPNCYVDKWVVGDKLRMGIFAERHIKAGEELVFNYNVDRYGADPQPCYCGEPNCTGFIGGKTQTERATKLSHTTIEALGIDDGDGWDTAVAKKPRKKKQGEDDEEYVNHLQPKGLDEDGVTKVMATLMQCKEKWIAVKLLGRIQRCDDDRVRNRVIRMHGYQILRTTLTNFADDNNVVLQVFDILYKFPRLTRNKISDAKIEPIIEGFKTSEHEDVAFEATRLLEEWSKLEVAYRIPRKKFDPNAQPVFERRESAKEESPKTVVPTGPAAAPTGPRSTIPQRSSNYFSTPRPTPPRRPAGPLPSGWFTAIDQSGKTYYYSKSGQTTWQRPYLPAVEPPPPPKGPAKAVVNQKALQDIIDSLTKADTSKTPSVGTPQPVETPKKAKKPEKWRSLPIEKQMKLYENTLFPHIKYVMDKFRNKLPKDDLKKFAKEIGKKLVSSDFSHNRVVDPTKINSKQEKKVKQYVKDYFDKAVVKKYEHDKRKARKAKAALANGTTASTAVEIPKIEAEAKNEAGFKVEESDEEDDGDDIHMSSPDNDEPSISTPLDQLASPSEDTLKRKREDNLHDITTMNGDATVYKRIKDEEEDPSPSPPPPPPPPPTDDMLADTDIDMDMHDGHQPTDEERELAEQEAELMRENEEALIKENEAAMLDAQRIKEDPYEPLPGSIDEVDLKMEEHSHGSVHEDLRLSTRLASKPDHERDENRIGEVKEEEEAEEETEQQQQQQQQQQMHILKHERESVLSH